MSSSPVRFTGPGPGGQKVEPNEDQKATIRLRKRIDQLRGNKGLLSRLSRPVGK